MTRPNVCGECDHFVKTFRNDADGICRAFVKLADGAGCHPIRERNRCACGFFRPSRNGGSHESR